MTDRAADAQYYIIRTVQHFCQSAGWHQMLHHTVCETAWPGTGEHDRRSTSLGVSFGEFQSLALALGGHRPFTGTSTADQMAKALTEKLPGRYEVHYRERELAYEVHRVA